MLGGYVLVRLNGSQYDYDYVFFFYVFFFKQKTAYEMRISDWSSDVCSSDLLRRRRIDIPPKLYRAQQTRDRFADLDSSTLHKSVTQFGRGNGGARAFRSRGSRSEERRVGKECVSTCRSR